MKPRYAIKSKRGKYLYSGITKCLFINDLFIAKEFPTKAAAEKYAKKMNDKYYEWANSTGRKDQHFPVYVIAIKMIEVDIDDDDRQ